MIPRCWQQTPWEGPVFISHFLRCTRLTSKLNCFIVICGDKSYIFHISIEPTMNSSHLSFYKKHFWVSLLREKYCYKLNLIGLAYCSLLWVKSTYDKRVIFSVNVVLLSVGIRKQFYSPPSSQKQDGRMSVCKEKVL